MKRLAMFRIIVAWLAMTGMWAGAATGSCNHICGDHTDKPIQDIRPGDKVVSRNALGDDSGKVEQEPVTATKVRVADELETLTDGQGGTVTTTPEHPFYVHGRGFVPAKDLAGASVSSVEGFTDAIAKVIAIHATGPVFNLTVDRDHSYFVKSGKHWLWVHNSCGSAETGGMLEPGQSFPHRWPTEGRPQTVLRSDGEGGIGSAQTYDAEGYAQTRIDFASRSGRSADHPFPHYHEATWGPGQRTPRGNPTWGPHIPGTPP